MVVIKDEIFSEEGERNLLANLFEIFEAALKKLLFRKHRDSRCSRGFIDTGESEGIKVLPDHALGGRCLFYLGNNRPPVPGRQGLEKTGRLRVEQRHVLKLAERYLPFLECEFLAFIGHDVIKNHTVSLWVSGINRSSVWAAAPLSIVFLANAIPSASEAAAFPA